MNKTIISKKIFTIIITVLLCLISSLNVIKADDTKIVKVGWYSSDMFQEGMSDDEKKSGYAYDYLQKISDYTNWKYEYVYGEWSDLFEKLVNGEIDFLCGVSISDERKEEMLFPSSSMGTDQYYLYKNGDDNSITISDLSSFDGKKIGLVKNNRLSDFTLDWINGNNVDVETVYFDSLDSLNNALSNNEIDLIAQTINNASNLPNVATVTKLGEEPFYVAINADRSDLLNEFNDAYNVLNSIDPFLIQDLGYKNYGSSVITNNITLEEKEYVNSHSSLTIGYLNNYLPYSDTVDGSPSGLLIDVADAMFEAIGLVSPEIKYISYDNYKDLIDALNNNEIDIAFPVLDNSYRLEIDNIKASSAVATDSGTLFYKTYNEKSDIKKIAVNKNNILQIDYSKDAYPNAELVFYSNIDECLKAVLEDKVDGTIMDTMRIQYVTANSEYSGFSYVQLSESASKCFGVRRNDKTLLLLLNRALKALGTSYGIECSYKYIDSFYHYGVIDFIKNHLVMVSISLGIFIVIIIGLLAFSLNRKEKRIIQEEKLKKEAEDANAAKSMFLFNMSHDIRTPMNALLGFTILMEKEKDNPEKISDYLNKMRISGDYLMNLINNVLEVARIDSGKESVDEDFMDILDQQYIVMFENDIKKKNLTVTKNINIFHRYIYSDKQKIREIVMNLLSNAIKYTPNGGHIHLDLTESICDKEGYATYTTTVSDDGIGMTKEFKEHIFESFSREKNSTESQIAGTGLGMSIVKKLTDLLGGNIEIKSEPGKGSSFAVTINARIAKDPEIVLDNIEKENKDENVDLKNKRILLAEDNELNAEIAKTIIEDAGAKVEAAKDGVECVNMLSSKGSSYYDLILMDIQMPNLDGYNATLKIRQLDDKKKASIPIIAMTANAFDEDKKHAKDVGMNGHVGKPIDVKTLIETLNNFLK